MRILATIATALAAGALAAENIPALREVKLRPRLGSTNVTMCISGATIRPSDFTVRHSLNGKWKFKGLERQKEPFGTASDSEREILSPKTDDRDWATIDVPLNWWMDERFKYEKVFNKEELFFRGYYRRSISVPNPSDGKRRFLRFDEIGAEAEIYVNGLLAGWHAGDFVPCEVEITRFLKPGDNLIGVRVLADFGPAKKDGKGVYARPYGARWDNTAIKGGIWHNVNLDEMSQVRIKDVRIDPSDDLMSVRVRGKINGTGSVGEFRLVAALVEDVRDAPVGNPSAQAKLYLSNGDCEFDIVVPAKGAKPWTPDDPNLYWMSLAIIDSANHPVAAQAERFGMRTMRVNGNRFLLNGKPVYLVGDSLHSLHYGGVPGKDAVALIRKNMTAYKAAGVNTLRTAHMPAVPEVCEFADEIGIMIYNEWANSFCNRIDEKEFERNNLSGLEAFVRRDYNHASVVLWSLGNEVKHQSPEIARQLDKQYDLIKRLDGQNRPACSFSGVADVWHYGTDRLKTDFLDTHDYLGIDGSFWSEWFAHMNENYAKMSKTYGKDGKIEMPLIMWECVGGGWGIKHDDGMRSGDVHKYVEWMNRPSSWDNPQGIPLSGTVGLLPILDRKRGRHYVQSYLATRLCELFRQDRRLAGFAPWFADPEVPGSSRWMQQAYPLLRNNARDDGRIMFRQLFSPGVKNVECVVVNDTDSALEDVRVAISLRTENGGIHLGECAFDRIAVFEEGVRQFNLEIPDGLTGDGEVCLELTGPNGIKARNGYRVRLHSLAKAYAPIVGAHEVSLAGTDAKMENILGRLAIPYAVTGGGKERWRPGSAVIVPPGVAYDSAVARTFVQNGGTLLILEPQNEQMMGFQELFTAAGTNHLVEVVLPAHPVFDGLTSADFDTWAERPFGAPVTRMVAPMGLGVLTSRPRYIRYKTECGMALCEYRVGDGRLIISTMAAEGLLGRNSAATRYLRNLLAYVSRGNFVSETPVLDDVKKSTK